MERVVYHHMDPEREFCVNRIHVEKTAKNWHIVVFVNEHCAGVLMVTPECGPQMCDLLIPPAARIEGATHQG